MLANYTDLLASAASWSHRTDLTAFMPDFVVLAEARISRDLRLRRQVSSATLATVAATQTVALPDDYLELENISCTSSGVERNLEYINIERMNVKYPDGSGNGVPVVYTLEGSNILFGPTPDAVYSIPIYYYAKFVALATTPTNWLMTNHPNIYLFATLAELADYSQDVKNLEKWESKYARDIKQLHDSDEKSMFSGSALRVRSV
jgi:hypothetical protein